MKIKTFTCTPKMDQSFWLLLIFLCLANWSSYSQSVPFDADRAMIDHLIEVNKEWKTQQPDWPILQMPVAFTSDEERIQLHLELVEKALSERDNPKLSEEQSLKRLQQLAVLNQYWQRGRFPKNTGHAYRQPYFIDQYGTACAVGYLALRSGQEELVNRIREENNFAYIREMNYPELQDWAQQNGFTESELAWIQPAYQPTFLPFEDVGDGQGVVGEIRVMTKDDNEDLLFIGGDFTMVDGIAANSVIAWDGQDWHTLGEGLIGKVNVLEYFDGNLYAGGNFHIAGEPASQNIAFWDGVQWNGLQEGEMEGEVLALHVDINNRLFMGGSFTKINGEDIPYLTYFDFNSLTWKNSVSRYIDGEFQEITGAFSVDAPVRCLEQVGNNLLVGGDFTKTAPDVPVGTVQQLEANYLAYWGGTDWVGALYGAHPPVHAVKYHQGNIYVGGDITQEHGLSILQGGIWLDIPAFGFGTHGDNHIHGFVERGGGLIAYGGFFFSPGVGIYGQGVMEIQEDGYMGGLAIFDNTVNAIIEFDGNIYFSGPFEEVNNQEHDGIVRLPLLVSSEEEPIANINLNVFTQAKELVINYDELGEEATISIFNINGQQLQSERLPIGGGTKRLNMSDIPDGIYVYSIVGDGWRKSGKFQL